MLTGSPDEITIGEIVRILEGGMDLIRLYRTILNACDRTDHCLTRDIWEEATKAMYDKLDSVTLSSIIQEGKEWFPTRRRNGSKKQ